MPKPVITFVFKVLRYGLLRYILSTCPNLWLRSCSKCYGTDCFGTYFTQCPNLWLHWCSKCYGMDCFGTYAACYTCRNLWLRSCSKCYGMDCLGTYTLHMPKPVITFVFKGLRNGLLRYIHMPKPVITFVFKVLRNGLLRYILYTCPNLWLRSCSKCYGMDCFGTYTCPNLWLRSCSKCYGMDCFGTYVTHAQTCDYVRVQVLRNGLLPYIRYTGPNLWLLRVQSATQRTASVHTLHMPKPVITFVFKVLRNGLLGYILYTCPNLWLRSCSKCYGMDCFGTYFTHAQTCDYVRVQSATEWTASVHTLHMPKPVITFVFKVLRNGLLRYIHMLLRNGLLRYIRYTCPNLWLRSCSKCYGMDCFGTYFTHAQTCDYVRVQSATEWTAWVHTLHMPKPVITFVFKVLRNGLLRYILYTCPNLWLRSCSKCYGMDCFGTYFTHAQTCGYVRVQSATERTASVHTLQDMPKPVITFVFKVLRNGLLRYMLLQHAQTCDYVRVQSATEWTASVHTLHMPKPVIMFVFKVLRNGLLRYIHMPKPVITFVFKVLRNGLLRYILYTCPNLWLRSCSKCYGMDCFGIHTLHMPKPVITFVFKVLRNGLLGIHTLHMPKPVISFVFKGLRNGLLRYILYTCPNLWLRSCSKCYGMDCFGTYFTHAQTCDYVRVQSATEWTASVHTLHMPKPVITFMFNLLRNGLLRYILYTCPNLWLYVRVQIATERTASVHTLHMPKHAITFVFKVLRNGLLRYIRYTCPNLWLRSCSKCYGTDCFGTFVTHAQTCDYVRVQSATEWTASVHTLHMPKPVITFVFKVLRNGLLRYILYTCPNLWLRSCSKCYGMDCFGTYFTHAQTCDSVRVQSATEWTASVHTLHMPKPVIIRSCSKCYGTDCFGTYFTHAQTCDYVRVQSATEWTASVHTLLMPKPVITFVFKVLRTFECAHVLDLWSPWTGVHFRCLRKTTTGCGEKMKVWRALTRWWTVLFFLYIILSVTVEGCRRGKLGQWPFVLGHLPISACFGIYSPFFFVGKNPIVQHLWLTNMWLDVICTDVALKMHFPFLERPPMHRQAPSEKTTTFLDVDLFWYGASAILNRTHRGAKTILLGPLWNSLERSWTPWT